MCCIKSYSSIAKIKIPTLVFRIDLSLLVPWIHHLEDIRVSVRIILKMDIQEVVCGVHWIDLAQGRDIR